MLKRYTRLDLLTGDVELTLEGRQYLKSLFKSAWEESGEGFNRATSAPEVADVWFKAVNRFLATKDDLADS